MGGKYIRGSTICISLSRGDSNTLESLRVAPLEGGVSTLESLVGDTLRKTHCL